MTIKTHSGFSKRVNSTKQPTGGTTVTCTLKDATSIENPVFVLTGGISSYSGISCVEWDGRYYFVQDIVSVANNITELHCAIDRMATFKSDILASSCFVERSQLDYDSDLADDLAVPNGQTYFIPTADSNDLFGITPGYGYLALMTVCANTSSDAGGGAGVWYLRPGQDAAHPDECMDAVINLLNTQSVYDNLKLTLTDAYNSIIKCTYVPIPFSSFVNDTTQFTQTDLWLGNASYSAVRPYRSLYADIPTKWTHSWLVDIESILNSPQRWLNRPPFSSWQLYLPYVGAVPVNIDTYLANNNKLKVEAICDTATGELTYHVLKHIEVAGVSTDYPIDKYQTNIGVNIPISQVKSMEIGKMISGIADVGAGLLTGNPLGAMSGGITGALGLLQSNVSTAGGIDNRGVASAHAFGFEVAGTRKTRMCLYQYISDMQSTLYSDVIGYPKMEEASLSSSAGGYVKTRNASIQCAGTEGDKEAINAILDSGAFLD